MIIPGILILSIFLIGATPSDIATASTQVALSAGMDYRTERDTVDTRIDAENASAAYVAAGCSTAVTVTGTVKY